MLWLLQWCMRTYTEALYSYTARYKSKLSIRLVRVRENVVRESACSRRNWAFHDANPEILHTGKFAGGITGKTVQREECFGR